MYCFEFVQLFCSKGLNIDATSTAISNVCQCTQYLLLFEGSKLNRNFHSNCEHSSYYCRPTNYELLRWLVDTPSRDFEHYRMSGGRLICYRIFITCQTTSWHFSTCQEVVWHVINILRCFCLRFFCGVFVFSRKMTVRLLSISSHQMAPLSNKLQ